MNRMKPIISATAALAVVFVQTVVQAQLITGIIGFAGELTLNSNSAGTATAVTSWFNTKVLGELQALLPMRLMP